MGSKDELARSSLAINVSAQERNKIAKQQWVNGCIGFFDYHKTGLSGCTHIEYVVGSKYCDQTRGSKRDSRSFLPAESLLLDSNTYLFIIASYIQINNMCKQKT